MAPAPVAGPSPRLRDVFVRHEVIASGILTGLAGGVAMMVIAMIGAAGEDLSPLHPAVVLGETLVGPGALAGLAAVAYGTLVLLVVSAVIGVLFAALVPRDFPVGSALGLGVGWALLAFMFVLMPLVVPLAHPTFVRGMQAVGGTWLIALFAFGLVLGTGPGLRRWVSGEARGWTRRIRFPRPPRHGLPQAR